MALQGTNNTIAWALVVLSMVLFSPNATLAKRTKMDGLNMNVIDRCWRWNPNW